MTEHDEKKAALDADNPPQQEGDSEKGLGTNTGAEVSAGSDMPGMMPEARGEVRYGDDEEPDTVGDASPGAKD